MSLLDRVFDGETISMEADETGQQKEREYEIYGKMVNLSDLSKASRTELQEQWGLPIQKEANNAAGGNIRVRQIDNDKYVLTSKIKEKDHNDEVNQETIKEMFIHFRKFATQGLRKVRHFFPIEGSDFVYEVDVFHNTLGQFTPWVKIDLEIPDGMTIDTLPDLPFEMEEIRVIPPGKKSVKDLEFVRELFDKHFNMHNQYVEPPTELPTLESREELLSYKDDLINLVERATGIAMCLSFNESNEEAILKQKLEELKYAVIALYKDEA